MRSTVSWHLLEGQNTSFCQVCPLFLQEGVELPDHLLHLPDVSPQLQVLAMGFVLGSFCEKMVESCVRLAGFFSADALLMDRHRAPAMSRDSICFGVYVDGVCAVGCNHSKVLAALDAVKVTLNAAGLRLSLTYQRKYSQVFSWIIRLGFCRWKPLASGGCDVVWSMLHGKGILRASGQVDWARLELPAASSGLVSLQCRVSLRAHFRTSKRAGMARSRPGIPLDCVIIATSHLQSCQSLVAMGLRHGRLGWRTRRLWCYASQMRS